MFFFLQAGISKKFLNNQVTLLKGIVDSNSETVQNILKNLTDVMAVPKSEWSFLLKSFEENKIIIKSAIPKIQNEVTEFSKIAFDLVTKLREKDIELKMILDRCAQQEMKLNSSKIRIRELGSSFAKVIDEFTTLLSKDINCEEELKTARLEQRTDLIHFFRDTVESIQQSADEINKRSDGCNKAAEDIYKVVKDTEHVRNG